MKSLHLLTMCIALVAFVACSKDKKDDTTPTTSKTMSADDGRGEAKAEAEPTSDDTDNAAPSDSAELTEVIYFEFDSSDLSNDAREKLNENADWLKEDGVRTITIEGHTDEVGTPDYNLALGERRARAAKDYMVRLGISEDRIRIITYGEEKPAGATDSENRRSVFVATSS